MTLGNFYAAVNRPEDAEKQYLKAVEMSPEGRLAESASGQLLSGGAKKDKAEASFKAAVDKDSKSIPAIARLADFYIDERKYAEGLKERRRRFSK